MFGLLTQSSDLTFKADLNNGSQYLPLRWRCWPLTMESTPTLQHLWNNARKNIGVSCQNFLKIWKLLNHLFTADKSSKYPQYFLNYSHICFSSWLFQYIPFLAVRTGFSFQLKNAKEVFVIISPNFWGCIKATRSLRILAS